MEKLRCFACDRVIHLKKPFMADTRDAQIVYVGSECHKRIVEAGEAGWQPPKGGPKLFPIEVGTFTDHAGQQIPYRVRRDDYDSALTLCEVNPHGDEWHPMGSGRTAREAIERARLAWNEYDSAP
jgi:hypothetical protein